MLAAPPAPARPQYLVASEAADHLRISLRSLHGLMAARAVPFVKRKGTRRAAFRVDQLDAWMEGADLEVVEKDDGATVIVRPVEPLTLAFTRSNEPAEARNASDREEILR